MFILRFLMCTSSFALLHLHSLYAKSLGGVCTRNNLHHASETICTVSMKWHLHSVIIKFLFSCKVYVVLAGSLVIAGLFVQSRPRKYHQIRILKIHSKTSVINDPPFIASDTGTFLRLRLRLCLRLRQCLRLSPCLRPSLRLCLHQRLCLCLYLLVLLS
jgi:hypothetical protein